MIGNYYIAVDRNGDFKIFPDIPIIRKIDIMTEGPEYEDPYGRFHKSIVPSGETFEDWTVPNTNTIGGRWYLGAKLKSSCIPNFLLDMKHEDDPYRITEENNI